MIFQLQHEPFQSISQWYAWRLGLDLTESSEPLIMGQLQSKAEEATFGPLPLRQFFMDFLADLYTHPQAYALPGEPYEAFTENRIRSKVDNEKQDRIRAIRLKTRKAFEDGLFDFLYQVGQVSELDGQVLKVSRLAFDQLMNEKVKKTKNKAFLQGFERMGFSFGIGNEDVDIHQEKHPGMLAALSMFAKTCSTIKEYGFYFFRRCDFGIFAQKRLPEFEDAMRLVSDPQKDEVYKTDAFLREHNFKREIFVADASAGYRLRYNKKSDRVVYWCRFMSWFSPDLHHNLRWDFDSDQTPGLFSWLGETNPILAERIFDGIKKCEHCYANCMARVTIVQDGRQQECCSEAGWDTIGESPSDFEHLRLVIGMLDDLASQKKKETVCSVQ